MANLKWRENDHVVKTAKSFLFFFFSMMASTSSNRDVDLEAQQGIHQPSGLTIVLVTIIPRANGL